MTVRQPLNDIRRSTVLADDADDKASTGFTARHEQQVTNVRPHHGTLSGAAGVIIILSANDPGTSELARTDAFELARAD
jgi:hypothetical protein